jgi:hypothetical protein
VEVSRHGEKRLRKRLNIPKKAVERKFHEALEKGIPHHQYKGQFRKYLDYWCIRHGSKAIVHQNTIFFIKGEVMTTAWQVPPKFQPYQKKVPNESNNSQG